MKRIIQEYKSDIPASIVVFFVAVPLCLGIALASGAPLFSGIIAGIVGGIVTGLLSGSTVGVSGPAAGLAVIVLGAIQTLGGSFEAFLLSVVIAGVIQLAMGYLKAGIIAYYFPSSVIKGMLSGIGLIIILKQIPHAFGYDADFEGDMSFSQPDGENTFTELLKSFDYINPAAIIVCAVSLFILILWEQVLMKKHNIFKTIQGPLVVVLTGIGMYWLFTSFDFGLGFKEKQLVRIPVPDSFSAFAGQFTLPDFSQITNPDVYVIAVVMAVIASLETLLCVEATDKLDPDKNVTPTNRELKAQGIGNIVSGMIGGLPVTQVIVRSSANIAFGAKTKMSAVYHGVLLLLSALAIPFVLNMIPLAALAAILFMVGYKLSKPSLFKQMYNYGWEQFIPFVVTVSAIVLTDLLKGIAIGSVVAIFFILKNNYMNGYSYHKVESHRGKVITIELAEEVTFINKGKILQELHDIPDNEKVIIDGTKSKTIDFDVIEIFRDFAINAKDRNIEVEIKGIKDINGFKGLTNNGNNNKNENTDKRISELTDSGKSNTVA